MSSRHTGKRLNSDTFTISLDSTLPTTYTYSTPNPSTTDTYWQSDPPTFDSTATIDITESYSTEYNLDISKVERMCIEYPALAKSWEQFQTLYNLVKDDFESKEEDNEVPF